MSADSHLILIKQRESKGKSRLNYYGLRGNLQKEIREVGYVSDI